MSGDVQPRKRKDRKKKREDDDLKESHHGVHATKLGTDDVLLHVQTEHSTGGHWCAKILFFSLLAILIGLIGLIIMENRGLSDLDTPLSESRYSEYFEGWVDEHRQAHDDHDKVTANLENHNAEPFEEEEDHSEQDIDDDDDHDDEHDHGDDDNDDENNVQENDDEDNNKEDDEDDHEEKVDEDDDNKNNNNNNDDDDDDVETQENEQIYLSNRHSIVKDNEKNEQDNDDETDEGIGDEIDDDNNDQTNDKDTESNIDSDKFDFTNENDPFDEVDEDNNDDSAEEIVENDAEELLHLERKAKEQEENDNKQNEPENEQEHSSSLAVKIIVGLALAFVARLVLIKKTDKTDHKNDELFDESALMKRRLTMVTAEEPIPWDDDEKADDLDIEDEYADEENEELQYSEDEDEKVIEEVEKRFVRSTFEELNAMYRPKNIENLQSLQKDEDIIIQKIQEPNINVQQIANKNLISSSSLSSKDNNNDNIQQISDISLGDSSNKNSIKNVIDTSSTENFESMRNLKRDEQYPFEKSLKTTTMEKNKYDISHKVEEKVKEKQEYEEDEENEENLEVDEEIEEEEDEEDLEDEEDIEDVSDDADDDDLMRRLDEKYGKLPERHFDSEDEDDEEDIDDRSWTKIKSKTRSGEQNNNDDVDDLINEQMRMAESERIQNDIFDFH